MNVTLTNAFEVSSERELSFLSKWERVMEFLRQQPGFVSVTLSRSTPESRFQFTAQTTFESQAQLWGAIRQTDFQLLVQANDLPDYPRLYDLFLRPQARAVA